MSAKVVWNVRPRFKVRSDEDKHELLLYANYGVSEDGVKCEPEGIYVVASIGHGMKPTHQIASEMAELLVQRVKEQELQAHVTDEVAEAIRAARLP